MAKPSNLSRVKDLILDFFISSGPKVYRHKDLIYIFNNNKDDWKLVKATRPQQYVNYIIEEVPLQHIKLSFPHRPESRYIYGVCSIYKITQSLSEKGYFSHRSAAEFHGLLDESDQIFFNIEQASRSQTSGELSQIAIDRAFQNKARITKNTTDYEGYTIWKLNGKNTDCYGVIDYNNRNNEGLRVTDIARTLVDMAVRPSYSGGPRLILQAYRKGLDLVSGLTMTETLVSLKHTYPYHQAVGYYMDRAGFSEKHLEPLLKIPMQFDFYLDNQIITPHYSKKWRLFYPASFDIVF
jgi:hypothetical protein